MGFLGDLFKKKKDKQVLTSPQIITFNYTLANPYFELIGRHRYAGSFFPLKQVKPFAGFSQRAINNVESIRTGPGNNSITIKNVTEYIEEPCIPVFLKLQELGLETTWADANSGSWHASIKVIKNSMSEENINIARASGLKEEYDGFELAFPIERTDIVKTVSNRLLELASIFLPQSVLYGRQTQSDF